MKDLSISLCQATRLIRSNCCLEPANFTLSKGRVLQTSDLYRRELKCLLAEDLFLSCSGEKASLSTGL